MIGVVGVKTDRVVEGTEPIGCDGKLIDAHDCSTDEILNHKLVNLSLKNGLKLLASRFESLLHKSPILLPGCNSLLTTDHSLRG